MRGVCIVVMLGILGGLLGGCGTAEGSFAPEASSSSAGASGLSPDQSLEEREIGTRGEVTARDLNDLLEEMDIKVGRGFDRDVFDDGYVCEDFEHAALYRTWKWVGANLNENVLLLYLKDEERFQPMDLGVYNGLRIRWVRETQDPDVLRVFFESDAAFSLGLTYYAKSFISTLDYSISRNRVVDRVYSPVPGRYGIWVEDDVRYTQEFEDCRVSDGRKAALRFRLLETNGLAGCPQGTEIILPQSFQEGSPGEILLPHVKMNLSEELLEEMSAMEGVERVTAQPMETGSGTRLVITPEPGCRASCGFDPEETEDWEATFYVFAEKVP